jgi:hypothetical protein
MADKRKDKAAIYEYRTDNKKDKADRKKYKAAIQEYRTDNQKYMDDRKKRKRPPSRSTGQTIRRTCPTGRRGKGRHPGIQDRHPEEQGQQLVGQGIDQQSTKKTGK